MNEDEMLTMGERMQVTTLAHDVLSAVAQAVAQAKAPNSPALGRLARQATLRAIAGYVLADLRADAPPDWVAHAARLGGIAQEVLRDVYGVGAVQRPARAGSLN